MQDPRGLTYQGVPSRECDAANVIEPLFPGLGLWSCDALDECVEDYKSNYSNPDGPVVHPNIALRAALYLTATSTSTEAEETTPVISSQPFIDQQPSAPQIISLPQQTAHASAVNSPAPLSPGEDAHTQLVPSASELSPGVVAPSPYVAPLGEALPDNEASAKAQVPLPVTQVPKIAVYTNAQGVAVTSTSLAAAIPVLKTSTDVEGNVVISTSLSLVAPSPSPLPVALPPVIVSSTDAEGNVAVATNFMGEMPILHTLTNAQGQLMISTSFSTLPISASVPTVIISTDETGRKASSTSYLPALVLTTTDAQGSPIITTSPLPTSPVLTGSALTPTITFPPALTIGAQAVTANALGQYIIGGQTLTAGGVITLSGTRVSLSPDEVAVIVGSSTENLVMTPHPDLTIGIQTVTANSLNQYIIGGQTLTPGGVLTLSGTRISLSPDETAVIVGSSTESLVITPPPDLTIGSQTITANSLDQYIIGGQTLTPGGVITVSGTRVSLATDETALVVGTSTEILGQATDKAGVESNGTQGPLAFTGSGGSTHSQSVLLLEAFAVFLGLGMTMWL